MASFTVPTAGKKFPLVPFALAALGLYVLTRSTEAGAAEGIETGIAGAPTGLGFPTGSQAQPTGDVVQTGARITTTEGETALPWYLAGGGGGGGGGAELGVPTPTVVATGAQVSASTPTTQNTGAAVVAQAIGGISGDTSGAISPQAPALVVPLEPAIPAAPAAPVMIAPPAEPAALVLPAAPEPEVVVGKRPNLTPAFLDQLRASRATKALLPAAPVPSEVIEVIESPPVDTGR